MSDLFAAAAAEVMQRRAPLAARLRPRRLDDLVGQSELEALEHNADTRRQALADMLALALAFFEERHVEPELLEPHGAARARWPSSEKEPDFHMVLGSTRPTIDDAVFPASIAEIIEPGN